MTSVQRKLKNLTHPVCIARLTRFIRHIQGPVIARFVVRERNLLQSDTQRVLCQLFYVHILVHISGFKFISLFGIFRPQPSHNLEYPLTCSTTINSVMSATRPARGRPRRTEAVKRVKLRQSTFLLWNQKKESLGLKGVSNSEFAEIFLHQLNMGRIGSETDEPLGSTSTPRQGEQCKNSEYL